MKNSFFIGLAVLVLLVLGIWFAFFKAPEPTQESNTQNETGQHAETPSEPVGPAAEAARAELATTLAVSEDMVTITNVEARTWTDGCLGLGGPAESCLQALVEGYRVEMQAQGKTYVYRTDSSGSSLRLESSTLP
ncbi:MAG TPA: hypothetical protein VEB18_02725 [Candidatus Paceibacterota bacterium]|nr:hypothetical protein [Candidatus Paceibacterota bacterium]